MSNEIIWVLIANDNDAAICALQDGQSRLLQVVARGERNAATVHERRDFAWKLIYQLFRGVRRGEFDGVVVIAPPSMLAELRRLTGPEIRKLVVAEIAGAPPADFLTQPDRLRAFA